MLDRTIGRGIAAFHGNAGPQFDRELDRQNDRGQRGVIFGSAFKAAPRGQTGTSSGFHAKETPRRHAEQDLPDRLEMRAACLDLLRERVHVAEAALERAAQKDRVDARGLVGEVRHLGRALDRVGAGEPHAGPIDDRDRRHVVGLRIDRGERLDQIGAAPSRAAPPRAPPRPARPRCRRAGSGRAAPCGPQCDELGQHRARDAKATAATRSRRGPAW